MARQHPPELPDGAAVVVVPKRQKDRIARLVGSGYLPVDVSCTSTDPTFRRFSPIHPHGPLPVPGLADAVSWTVEGAWNGLKVFEGEGIDASRFSVRAKKRSAFQRRAGGARGSLVGFLHGGRLVSAAEAAAAVYEPCYARCIAEHLRAETAFLVALVREGNRVALLDSCPAADDEEAAPSHAHVLRAHLAKELAESPGV